MTGRVRYAHFLLWHGDAAYRRAWLIAPQILAMAGLVFVFAQPMRAPGGDWGKPATPPVVPIGPPPGGPPNAPARPQAASPADAEALRDRARNDAGAMADLASRAETGDANMQFYLGTLYDPELKLSASQNWNAAKAAHYYRLAAEQGMTSAQANYGLILAYGKFGMARDPQAGFSWLEKAANAGLAMAQREVAEAYQGGVGVAADPAKAVEFYRKAVDQGDIEAKLQLADFYWAGKPPVAQDRVEAVKLYRDSSGKFPAAARMVGWAYMLGVGGAPTDRPTALQWFRNAADRGDPNAKSVIGDAYYDGWPPYPRDRAEAIKWYKAAAVDPNQVSAIRRVGIALRDGDGVLPDPAEAAAWMRRAADKNDVYAEAELGAGYFSGNLGYKQDYSEAFKWLSKAAVSKEVPVAQRLLGICYLEGYGVAPNSRQGFYWLQQASNNGDREATRILRRNR